jgi:hypothetical protein
MDVGAPTMEGIRVKSFGWKFLLLLSSFVLGCSSSPLKYSKADQLAKNAEFEKAVKIEHTEPELNDDDTESDASPAVKPTPETPSVDSPATPSIAKSETKAGAGAVHHAKSKKGSKAKGESGTSTAPTAVTVATKSSKTKSSKSTKNSAAKASGETTADKVTKESPNTEAKDVVATAPGKREPDIEDDEGFAGRRPLKDPFHVGEVVTYDVHYFKVSAGTMKLKVDPMVNVNGKKAYNFVTELKSSSMFSSFYSVQDRVETFVDFETLVPRVFSLHVKETSQLREAQMVFDEKTLHATYWEKKVTEKSGEEEKKQSWEIQPYSQNVFSAAFYMRNFQWEVGKEISFRVADDEQNLIFKGKCLRKETLDTEMGPKRAIVIKPEVTLKGAFKPVGDIYIWLSDDDRKYVLRIESKIKIGTIVAEAISIKPGRN